MAVIDWFVNWQITHVERCPRADWPDLSGAFWDALRIRFINDGTTYDQATKASLSMALEPCAFLDQHHKELLILVSAARAEDAKNGRDANDPDEKRRRALESSADCAECGGMGLTVRFLERRKTASRPYRVDAFTCYCHRCEMGRWVKMCHEKTARDAFAKITDLAHGPDEMKDLDAKVRPNWIDDVLAAEPRIVEAWGILKDDARERMAKEESRGLVGRLARLQGSIAPRPSASLAV